MEKEVDIKDISEQLQTMIELLEKILFRLEDSIEVYQVKD